MLVMALLLVLVCVTGSWVYSRLSSIVDSEMPSEYRVSRKSIVADMNNNLLKADNLTYAFLFEGNEIAQIQFKGLKGRTFDKLVGLKHFRKSDTTYQNQIEQLHLLLDQRFDNQEAMMAIQNENRVDETMSMVVNEVQNSRSNIKIDEPQQAAAPVTEEKKKWFKRKKEQPAVAKVEQPRINANQIAEQSRQQISSKLRSVQERAVSKEDYENELKLDLEQENTLITKKINERFRTILLADKRDLEKETQKAKAAAKETNSIILVFLLISVLLIATIVWLMIMIFRKTRSTSEYLRTAKEKSDQLTEAKSRFLATMSHEIRTPLNAISGFSDQLYYEKLPSEVHHKVDIIRSSAQHLTQITNEVLDLSRLERDHIQLEAIPFNIKREITAVQEQFGFQLGSRNNSLKLDGELKDWVLIGDPLRFRQMLINLIGNANKFSENSEIIIDFKAKEIKDKLQVQISVIDHGIGIEKSHLDNIFQPFEQADISVARKYGGTGLGLSITKIIIDKMNGKISVKSTLGKGTAFTLKFELPIDGSELPEEETRKDFSFLKNKTVLLVDDEPFNRLLLKAIFDGVEMTLLEATNGLEALDIIENNEIDVVLLDVHMPEMDGNELVARISESNREDKLIVVGLTASLDDATRKKMLLEGWTEVLTKPIKPEELSEILHRLTVTNQEIIDMDKTNFEGLKKLSNNNMVIYRDLLETFVTSTNNGRNALQTLLAEQQWNSIGEKAHQLAAPFKHFDAMQCYGTLKEIEKLGKSNESTDKIPALVESFLEDSSSVLEQIQTEINTL